MEGQRRLGEARVLLIGAGGLGSPAALYLAAAGVGQLGIVDPDRVELSNLQRQVLHSTPQQGRLKVDSARERLAELNPEVSVTTWAERFGLSNAEWLVGQHDLVIDGSDNLDTRYLANDACHLAGKPYIYASVYRFEGQLAVFHSAVGGPCYRCLFPVAPSGALVPSCSEAGVLGTLPGMAGTMQAQEALVYLLGGGRERLGRLLTFDLWRREFREVGVPRDPKCALCGAAPSITELRAPDVPRNPMHDGDSMSSSEITPAEFKQQWDAGRRPLLVDVRRSDEYEAANLAEYDARLIPLHEFTARYSEIPQDADIVIHCKSGGRSGQAQEFLQAQGYSKVQNMTGGMLRWAKEVDPSKVSI